MDLVTVVDWNLYLFYRQSALRVEELHGSSPPEDVPFQQGVVSRDDCSTKKFR